MNIDFWMFLKQLYHSQTIPQPSYTTAKLHYSQTTPQPNYTTAKLYHSQTLPQPNYTTAKLYSPDISRCVDFTRLRSSQEEEPNLTGELEWVTFRQSFPHWNQFVSPLLMTVSFAQSNTKHSRWVTCNGWQRILSGLRKDEVVCVHFYISIF
jgi:hypothetical protein